MKNNIVIILITLAVFVGGLVMGIITQQHKKGSFQFPVPPMSEFANGHGQPDFLHTGHDRPDMEEHVKQVRAEIDAFAGKMDAIHEDFRKKVNTILKQEQKEKWNVLIDRRKNNKHFPMPMEPHRRGDMNFIGVIIYKPALERISADLNLDSAQKQQVEKFLRERREKTIELIDNTPPPSIGGESKRFRG